MPVTSLSEPRVVAAVYSPASLAAALALRSKSLAPDWLELRLDAFHTRPGKLDRLVELAPRPMILTVRHPAEGGAKGTPVDPATRRGLYERFLTRPAVVAVDVELRCLRGLAAVAKSARESGRWVIASHHDFSGVPTAVRLRELAERARGAGADIFKLAATVEHPGQLARLLDLLEWGKARGQAMAVMGMGPLGRVSRLALAAGGSVLNYGYLGAGQPQVPGQWPVETLRERIDECRS